MAVLDGRPEMDRRQGILRVMMIFTVLLFSIARADEMPEIARFLKAGDPVKFADYYCVREDLMRDLLRLFGVSGEKNALSLIQGISGRDACGSNNYSNDDRGIRGSYVRLFADPARVKRKRTWPENHWIVEVTVEDKPYFTYLTDSQISQIKQAAKASAATN